MFCLSLKCLLEMNQIIQPLQNVELSQIQYSNFQNPPINRNPCPMTDVPYSTASGSSNLTYTMENVPTRGNTDSYKDFLNSSK